MADQQHPITPPPELIRKWNEEAATAPMADQRYIATQAARWGSDQELEACCEVLAERSFVGQATILREWRRPKPPSLAEEALTLLDDASTRLDAAHENTIRTALKRLQELENNG